MAQLKELVKQAGFTLEDPVALAFVDRARKRFNKVVTGSADVARLAELTASPAYKGMSWTQHGEVAAPAESEGSATNPNDRDGTSASCRVLLCFAWVPKTQVRQLVHDKEVKCITVDSSHDTNRHGYYMTDVTVRDENNHIVPVLLAFHVHKNTETYEFILRCADASVRAWRTQSPLVAGLADSCPAIAKAFEVALPHVTLRGGFFHQLLNLKGRRTVVDVMNDGADEDKSESEPATQLAVAASIPEHATSSVSMSGTVREAEAAQPRPATGDPDASLASAGRDVVDAVLDAATEPMAMQPLAQFGGPAHAPRQVEPEEMPPPSEERGNTDSPPRVGSGVVNFDASVPVVSSLPGVSHTPTAPNFVGDAGVPGAAAGVKPKRMRTITGSAPMAVQSGAPEAGAPSPSSASLPLLPPLPPTQPPTLWPPQSPISTDTLRVRTPVALAVPNQPAGTDTQVGAKAGTKLGRFSDGTSPWGEINDKKFSILRAFLYMRRIPTPHALHAALAALKQLVPSQTGYIDKFCSAVCGDGRCCIRSRSLCSGARRPTTRSPSTQWLKVQRARLHPRRRYRMPSCWWTASGPRT